MSVALAIDLNSDVGEGFGQWSIGDDLSLLNLVTSVNVACGFHAGDPSIMRGVCAVAAEKGVVIGAQVGYRDLVGFGRRFIDVEPDHLRDDVVYQIAALDGFARLAGTSVHYVKPEVARRCVRIVSAGTVEASDGSTVTAGTDSICIHGDTPDAVDIARGVRQALTAAGVTLRPVA